MNLSKSDDSFPDVEVSGLTTGAGIEDGGGGDGGGGGDILGGGGDRLGGGGDGPSAHELEHVKVRDDPLSPTSNPLILTSPDYR